MSQRSLSIEITDQEMEAFLQRVERRCLIESDYLLIQAMADSIRRIRHVLQEKDASIGRLVRMLFGAKTESAKHILKGAEKDKEASSSEYKSLQEHN